MSFSILLSTNKSDKRKVTKTLTTIATLSGTLKQSTSIIDPVIIIEATQTQISALNYLTITDFKRSYFVNNIKSLKNSLWELTCHVDVISSFATEIRANTAIINRQETKWNLFLNDDSLRCYQNPTVVTREFPSGFYPNESTYVLLVAGSPV